MQHGLKLRAEVKPSSPLADMICSCFQCRQKNNQKEEWTQIFPRKKTWALNHQGKLSLSDTSLWRNRLARSAVNRKVGGSSPPRDELFFSSEKSAFWLFFVKIDLTNGVKIVKLSGWPSGLRRQTQGQPSPAIMQAGDAWEFWYRYLCVGSNPTSDKHFYFFPSANLSLLHGL